MACPLFETSFGSSYEGDVTYIDGEVVEKKEIHVG